MVGETTVQARHVTELRDAINAVRAHFNLPNYPWTKPTASSGAINSSVLISWEAIDEMRTALNQALGAPANGYAPNLGLNQPVKAIHIQELRDRVTNTWNLYGSSIVQAYDGDGLRVKKTQSGASTWYLRSSVLGGQVIAEVDANGWERGYVYAGNSLLAVQQGGVFWMYEDPVTKSKRVCDANGNVVSGIETDPFGADTSLSFAQAFQPKKFTSYDRDANGSDEAMFRRYNRWHSRFDQPDPYQGSYSLSNPQSLNRYAYTNNDPVNFVDPSGLNMESPDHGWRATDGMGANGIFSPGIHTISGWWQTSSVIDGVTTMYPAHYYSYTYFVGGGFGSAVGGDPHSGDPGGGVGVASDPWHTQINKAYAWVGWCNRSANDLMRTVRRDFAKFGNFSESINYGLAIGFLHFASGAITQGRVININTGAISTSPPFTVVGRNISVTVSSVNSSGFRFTTNPGHVFYPGQISFAAQDTGHNHVAFSITLSGQLADAGAEFAFRAGFGKFEDDSWHHFLDLISQSCGNSHR